MNINKKSALTILCSIYQIHNFEIFQLGSIMSETHVIDDSTGGNVSEFIEILKSHQFITPLWLPKPYFIKISDLVL